SEGTPPAQESRCHDGQVCQSDSRGSVEGDQVVGTGSERRGVMLVHNYEVSLCRALVLFTVMFASSLAFAGIHDACHTDNKDSKTFAVAYAGAIIDLKGDETT